MRTVATKAAKANLSSSQSLKCNHSSRLPVLDMLRYLDVLSYPALRAFSAGVVQVVVVTAPYCHIPQLSVI